MFSFLKVLFQIRSTYVLLLLSLFSISLSIGRVIGTHNEFYLFLYWNLFLAFIPWVVASFIYSRKSKNVFSLVLLILVWLLFFPNAPYLMTDLLHLGKGTAIPLWYDLILLLSYSFTGMLFGFTSLNMIEEKLKALTKLKIYGVISAFLIYLSCFGIYLGRFLRWNSWDLLTNMRSLISDVSDMIVSPFDYPATWEFTFLFGTLLNVMYLGYKEFGVRKG